MIEKHNLSQYLEKKTQKGKKDVREIFEFVRAWFLEHVKGLLEIQEKVEEEEKMVDPKALNRLFGGACSLCNVGRFIEEKHEDLSFSVSQEICWTKRRRKLSIKTDEGFLNG